MELLRVRSTGRPAQVQTTPGSPEFANGVLGAALSPKEIDEQDHTVVQLLLDDDAPGFDAALLDCPLVAEIRTPAGDVVTRDLFDHDAFRRRLHDDRASGTDELRGVLLLTGGELPPHYIRLAYLPVPVAETDGCDVVVVRSERDALVESIDAGLADGSISEPEHHGLRTTIEQRHGGGPT